MSTGFHPILTLHLLWKWTSSTFNAFILPLGAWSKFLTRTLSPSANCRSFFVLSCYTWCCNNCWVSTRCLTSGWLRSSRIRKLRLNSSSAGVTPVVVCGVDLYTAEFGVHCTWRSFELLHSAFENTDWPLHQAIRRWIPRGCFHM